MVEQKKETVPVENCTGCSACAVRCPADVISMVENQEGSMCPEVDHDACTDCGLCLKICPANTVEPSPPAEELPTPLVYAAWSKDDEIRRQSSSGGIFSELAKKVLDCGGVVFGAAYDEDLNVRHIAVESVGELQRLRGSKYVQSDIGETFLQAKELLASGREVFFSGTPCEIAGLHAALERKQDNLLTCDLICHGVPSRKVFRKYLDEIEQRYGSKANRFDFRSKKNGWKRGTVTMGLENGQAFSWVHVDNPFLRGFIKHACLVSACHACPIKSGPPVADLTLGDFWVLPKVRPELDDDKGLSAVLVHTERGQAAMKEVRERLVLTECPYSYFDGHGTLKKSVDPHPRRDEFFAELDKLPFDDLATKYFPPRPAIIRFLANIRRATLRTVARLR